MTRRARTLGIAALVSVLGCHGSSSSAPRVEAPPPPPAEQVETHAPPTPEAAPEATPAPRPYTPASSLPAPIEVRVAERTRLVYTDADPGTELRGRVHARETFYIYERRAAPGCKREWGLVAEAAWVCLERSSEPDPGQHEAPRALPLLEDDALLPFIYARHRAHKQASTPPIPVYRSAKAYHAGDPPLETLPAYGSYAFTKVRERGGEVIMKTRDLHMVEGSQLDIFDESTFAGVELAALPPGDPAHVLAWAVRWKTMVHTEPDPASPTLARIKYHATLELGHERVEVAADDPADRLWFVVPAHGDAPAGWIRADEVRRFLPMAPPEPVLGGQLTLDVDLDEQVLTVWREREPIFATLISSGKKTDRTPTGLYRILNKRAYGKMESLATAKQPYFVDAVPWTMYFQGRYAFHTAYWHDMFGHRMSHGCVNLSPRDAKRVFELATPTLPPGWLLVHEHARDPGTLVRIRRDGAPLPDKREPLPAAG